MTILDLFVTPIYLIVLYGILFLQRNKNYRKDNPLRKYYLPAFTVKAVGAISAGLIYFFYYKTGDTVFYAYRSQLWYELFLSDTKLGLDLLFGDPFAYNENLGMYFNYLVARDTSAWLLVRIAGVCKIFTLGSYMGVALLFAFISFKGVWALFKTFAELYPDHVKYLATACLFIPSVFFWGSGVFKDTFTLTGVCWMTRTAYLIFFKREAYLKNAIIFLIAFYITFVLKAYIALCLVPSLMLWIFFTFGSNIKSAALRMLLMPIILGVAAIGGYLFISKVGATNSHWSVDQIQDRAKDMQWWHTRVKEIYGEEGGGGSFYSVGNGQFTASNLIISFPQAVVVSLFRPFLWEARNPVMLLSSLEGLVMLIFTLKLIFKAGFKRIFKYAKEDPVIFFCLFFSITFGFAVGFTSFNFGALVRYKIPLMPFYVAALYLIRYHVNKDDTIGRFARTEKVDSMVKRAA